MSDLEDKAEEPTNEETLDLEGTFDVQISNKNLPLLKALTEAWEYKDIKETLHKSVMLMVYLTHLSEQGHSFYVQDPSGNSKEISLLRSKDVSKESKEIESEAIDELKNSLSK